MMHGSMAGKLRIPGSLRGGDRTQAFPGRKQLLYPGALPSGEAYEVDEANQESPCESMVIVVIGHACADHLTTTM